MQNLTLLRSGDIQPVAGTPNIAQWLTNQKHCMRRDRVRVTVHTAKCTGARIIMEQQIVKLPCAGDAEQQVMGTSSYHGACNMTDVACSVGLRCLERLVVP